MSDRFFCDAPIGADRATLRGAEAHHLLHVMRAAVGDEVFLFDGSGAEFRAEVVKLGRAEVELRIRAREEVDRELPFRLTLGVALPKGDRQKWLVEKLTELGVTALVPLVTERGVAQPSETAIERLRRSVVEAAKQCGRNRLMEIGAPRTWSDWLSAPPPDALRLVAHPTGRPGNEMVASDARSAWIAIGPEGGLSDPEVAAAEQGGWNVVSIGPRILRVETAAVALAAAIAIRHGPANSSR